MKEGVYRRCFAHSLRKAGHKVEIDRGIDVEFDDLLLPRAMVMDVVVDDTIVCELKARDVPLEVWNSQIIAYLWHSGLPLGYVVNFHVPHLRQGIRPFVNLPRPDDSEPSQS